jgi:class 3 adenylate cyclase
VRCPTCHSDNREGAKFCGECATPLIADGQRSAEQLHALLPADVPRVVYEAERTKGERRHLSVLFCDLVDSTSIAANLDPEDWREIVTSYHDCATEAVARFGGYVAQLLGDGLLVFFGYPQAHEDDP